MLKLDENKQQFNKRINAMRQYMVNYHKLAVAFSSKE